MRTEIRTAFATIPALAAREKIGPGSHPIAWVPVSHIFTDLHDPAGKFVTHRHRRQGLEFVEINVKIGAANSRGIDLGNDLFGTRDRHRQLLNADVSNPAGKLSNG